MSESIVLFCHKIPRQHWCNCCVFSSCVIQCWNNLHIFWEFCQEWHQWWINKGTTDLVHLEPSFNNFGFVVPRHVGANSCVLFMFIVWRWKPKFDTGRSWAFSHINPTNIWIGHIKFVIAVFKFHIVCTIFVAKRMQNQVLDGIHADNLRGIDCSKKRGSWIIHRESENLLLWYFTLNFTFNWFWPRSFDQKPFFFSNNVG